MRLAQNLVALDLRLLSPSRAVVTTALLFVAQATSACDREIVHPTRGNIPRDEELAHVISIANSVVTDPNLRHWAHSLSGLVEVLRIGAQEGEASRVFGKVQDVAMGNAGIIYVLDTGLNEIQLFNLRGEYVGELGPAEDLFGEFVAPQAMALDGRGRVVVADLYRNLKTFERQPSGAVVAHTYRLPAAPRDLCAIGDVVYVQGFRFEGGSIHKLLPTGDVSSFGMEYQADHWLVRQRLSRGPIGCVGSTHTIVGALATLPVIYGYSTTGTLLWVSKLSDFTSPTIVEGQDRKGHYIREESTDFDIARRLVWLEEDYVLLQVGRFDSKAARDGKEYSLLRTYLVSAQSGDGVFVGEGVEEVFAFHAPYLVTARQDPVPQVRIFQLGDLADATIHR